MSALGTRHRPGLSEERIVAAARDLLVEGGPERVVIREVARRLDVAPSSLYKHVSSRDDVLTLLIAAGYEEVSLACERGRDAEPVGAHRARLVAASLALRQWAVANARVFDLVLGAPLWEYTAPPDGPTVAAARRFGQVFASIYSAAAADGALRVPVDPPLPLQVRDSLAHVDPQENFGLEVDEMYLLVVGWQRLLGLVRVEMAGQLGWALADTEPFVRDQLASLTDELLRPGTP